jgi:hypothetical protein
LDIQANPTPEEVWRAFQRIGAIATGRALDGIAVGTTVTAVRHFLGRVPQYWMELSPQNGAALVKESAAPDSTNLYLIASSAVTATLWCW